MIGKFLRCTLLMGLTLSSQALYPHPFHTGMPVSGYGFSMAGIIFLLAVVVALAAFLKGNRCCGKHKNGRAVQ